ncbi:membrane protein UL56 [Equid alphaherpesvirus 4]|uniref:1 n=2 Tax=Equid alphaherpesvirus 4 TaxID=10331 RepID=A0A288CFU7_EHV4|nr:membrane protein UL56 [Equid alphaherpesvirus 4]AAC59523.1 1 [Equid alphaherpesvirus 4] [Equid alphaherpesvirus 4]AMB15889.1 membrane protein UL56 [Equid alphaherpesvirus 4]AMB15968.1 membrane protein UL56 [Equid alphaherpesvirus 4]AMB16047.1 membrane protein UL56 [Equid alphaherpesvirus 4]AMB16126.1 membrane protein UL56 [Equid alphaherpesvirus 4]
MRPTEVSRGRASSVSISVCPPQPSGKRRASLGCAPPQHSHAACCAPPRLDSSYSQERSLSALRPSRDSRVDSIHSLGSVTYLSEQQLPSRPPSYTAINPEGLLERGVERPRAWTASVISAPPSYSEAMFQAPPAYELVPELSCHPTQDPRVIYSQRSRPQPSRRRENPVCIFVIVVITMLLILALLLTITLSSLTKSKN